MNKIQWLIECDGIFFSFIAIISLWINKYHITKSGKNIFIALFINMLLPFFDILAFSFQGQLTPLAIFLEHISNFAIFFLDHLLIVFMGRYIAARIEQHDPNVSQKWLGPLYAGFGLVTLGLVISQFTGSYYYFDSQFIYHRGPFFIIPMGVGTLAVIYENYKVINHRNLMDKSEFLALISYFIFPTIGLIFQIFQYNISAMNIGLTISVIFILIEYAHKEYKIKKDQEKRITLGRAYLLSSQIKPHFFFNALSVIQALIDIDPDTAQEALGHFSSYMRKNLNIDALDTPVDIDEELDFIRNYLYIQNLRFGDRVNVSYDVEENLHFQIPFLTVQPLVENSIQHGIRQKLEGGNILIKIYSDEKDYVIKVVDDGVGFDYSNVDDEPKDINSNGVGMKNVEQRLQLMCNATMQVESEIGTGSEITIRVPHQDNH